MEFPAGRSLLAHLPAIDDIPSMAVSIHDSRVPRPLQGLKVSMVLKGIKDKKKIRVRLGPNHSQGLTDDNFAAL